MDTAKEFRALSNGTVRRQRRALQAAVVIIFASEMLLMCLEGLLTRQAWLVPALLDSSLLVLLVFPALYFFLFLPNAKHAEHREAMELALLENEGKLSTIFATMSEGVALNEIVYNDQGEMVNYRILEVNDAFYATADFRGRDVVGRLATDVYDMSLETITAFWRAHRNRTDVQHTELLSPLNNRWFDVSTSPFVNHRFVTSFIEITDRKLAEGVLRESEAKYRDLVETSQDLIWRCDALGRFTFLNAAWESTLGYTRAEMLGRPFSDFQHPEQVARDRKEFGRHLSGGSVIGYETVHIAKSGADVRLLFNAIPFHDAEMRVIGAQGTATDITERARANAALLESDQEREDILDVAPDGFWVVSLDGRFLEVNEAYCRMSGYTTQELLGMRIADVEANESPVDIAAHMARIQAEGQARFETRHRRKDGRLIDVAMKVRYRRAQGGRMLGFAQDITERKRAEAALVSSLREKDALLKEVHHRVKNNLQVVTSLLRLESGRSAHGETKGVVAEMQGRIRSMALLHESLYRSGTFATVDLGDYLRQVTTQSVRAADARLGAIELRLDLAAATVALDQAMPCGLLVNELVSNSLKHGFPNGQSGEIRVELHVVDGGPQLCLRVSNTGVGLPADFAERRGNSLGLQLVSDLTRQLGGTLSIGPGPGASFSVVFVPAGLASPPPPA